MAKRKPPYKTTPRGGRRTSEPAHSVVAGSSYWIWGRHAVLAALGNKNRQIRRLLVSEEAMRRDAETITALLSVRARAPEPESAGRGEIEEALNHPAAVHQGYALETRPLAQPSLEEIAKAHIGQGAERRLLICLDQASDPANIGAVLRSAAAFGAAAVVTTQRHAPGETGAMAKTASGAMECVPYIQVPNLAQALESLKKQDYWCLGLASEAELPISGTEPPERTALVMGAEGQGLRRLTRERCDMLLSLPTPGPLKELNLSVATAVALYELLARPR